MGTKLQSKSYTLYEDSTSSSSWSDSYEDKRLNNHLRNRIRLRPQNWYSGHDTEMLERSMLGHESTFGDQVCQLHVYRTENDMIEAPKRKELFELPLQKGASQSYLFSSATAPENETAENIWHIPHSPVTDVDNKPSLELLKEGHMQFSQTLQKNEVSLKGDMFSNSKPEGLPRQTFDLQLPAEVYIDDNDAKITRKQSISDVKCETDVKLTLGSSDNPVCFEDRNSLSMGSSPHINEPGFGFKCEEEAVSVHDHFLYGVSSHEETHAHEFLMRSDRNLVTRDFFTDKHVNGGACSNYIDADKRETGQHWPPSSYGNERNKEGMSSFNPNMNGLFSFPSKSSRRPKLKLKRAHYDQNQIHTRYEEQPNSAIGHHQKSSPFPDTNYSALSNSQVIPYSELPPPVLPRRKSRKVTYVPIAVQALPCFPASEVINYRRRKMKALTLNSTNTHSSKVKNKHTNSISVIDNFEGCTSDKLSTLPNGTKEKDSHNQPLEEFLSSSQIKKIRKRKKRTSQSDTTKRVLSFPLIDKLPPDTTFAYSEDKVFHKINMQTISSLAAENLVAISLNLTDHFPRDSFDSLHWFADVVSSKSVVNDDGDNGVDDFEDYTLKLVELKPDEYLPKSSRSQMADKATSFASQLVTRARKGHSKKKLHKKDFLTEILPGLVSLAKHEVAEDLQTFDCIMKAMGEHQRDESNLIKDCREERGVMVWGRTVKRGRRPRVKQSNLSFSVALCEGISKDIPSV